MATVCCMQAQRAGRASVWLDSSLTFGLGWGKWSASSLGRSLIYARRHPLFWLVKRFGSLNENKNLKVIHGSMKYVNNFDDLKRKLVIIACRGNEISAYRSGKADILPLGYEAASWGNRIWKWRPVLISKTFAVDYRLAQPHMLLWYAQVVEIFYFHKLLALTDFNHMIGPLRRYCQPQIIFASCVLKVMVVIWYNGSFKQVIAQVYRTWVQVGILSSMGTEIFGAWNGTVTTRCKFDRTLHFRLNLWVDISRTQSPQTYVLLEVRTAMFFIKIMLEVFFLELYCCVIMEAVDAPRHEGYSLRIVS